MEGSFDNIDMMFQEIELFLQTFTDDDNIDEASIDLVVAAFAAIESVMDFSSINRIGGSILKRGDYEKEALATLDTVQSKGDLLIRQAKNSQMWMVRQGFQTIKETSHIKDMILSLFDPLLDELDARREKDRSDLLKVIYTFSRPASPVAPPYSTVEPDQYIKPQELLSVPNVTGSSSTKVQGVGSSRISSQLLVHGKYDDQRYVSGLSLFCSSFAQSLEARAPRFTPLIFCRLHTDPDTDRHTGGRTIIQNFICQLLCQFDFDTRSFASEKLDEHLIKLGDVGELCRLFQWLVGKLPQSVVLFCLIDGVGYYERKEFEHHIGFVVEKLAQDIRMLRPMGHQKILVEVEEILVEIEIALMTAAQDLTRSGYVLRTVEEAPRRSDYAMVLYVGHLASVRCGLRISGVYPVAEEVPSHDWVSNHQTY
ncbi:hypothetical protein VC83_03008 [Pseudogymnoascus destructans]|uniref:Uncharacterized protein n=1 Tax=Pseudogymnoascus destructans TaxID=655981 RepID=A0A177ACS3_9PEZI|nr:uncharacterized protein VC83_03008 [Pseudogymnoascus destructans]OAF59906.1 hypothetical protein VC83_03008 [Pseudogymnoascus destructans]